MAALRASVRVLGRSFLPQRARAYNCAATNEKARLILGIETSCDDTGAAVVTTDGRILGEAIAGQVEVHAPWGGVVPSLAKEAHQAAIDRVVADALSAAGVSACDLDAVADRKSVV